jgi:hypothetical protein
MSDSELDYEQAKADRLNARPPIRRASLDVLAEATRYASDALIRGFDLITTRRLAEAIQLPDSETQHMIDALEIIPIVRRGPIWDLRAIADRLSVAAEVTS